MQGNFEYTPTDKLKDKIEGYLPWQYLKDITNRLSLLRFSYYDIHLMVVSLNLMNLMVVSLNLMN